MKDIAVVMYHFPGVNEAIYARNFQSFVDRNPDAYVESVYRHQFADERMRHIYRSGRSSWFHSDMVLYDFYRRNPGHKYYVYSEWDVFCNARLAQMIEPVRQFDLLAKDIHYPKYSDSPILRVDMKLIPPEMQKWVCSSAPLAGVCARGEALEYIARPNPISYRHVFCEARIATLANANGLKLARYPLFGHHLYELGLNSTDVKGEGLWHPVKFLVS